jgi:16S rRNA processing protein RimM
MENILEYGPWQVCIKGTWRSISVIEGRRQGKAIVAHLQGFDDREQSSLLRGADIAIDRSALPPAEEGTYYWSDLQGLTVINRDNIELGTVDYLIDTGANDVLVVKGERERLIPYIRHDVIVDVNLNTGVIRVDWNPDD